MSIQRAYWWGPSLVRRVMLALLMAFALVWVVLLAIDYLTYKRASIQREPLHHAVNALLASLDVEDDASALVVMKGTELQYNLLRRTASQIPLDDLQFQLNRADGTLLYASVGLAGQALNADEASQASRDVGGKPYWVVTQLTPRWRVTLLEPAVADGSALRWLAQNLVQPMLIAFPLVVIPLWLAVRRGLRPLRELVQRVANRAPADFSPLDLDLRYAELRPLESSFNDLLRQARTGIQSERGFVQDAAHELRTPLAVMAAQAHALSAATDAQTQQQARIALEQAIERASHLVHQLLTLARLEACPPAALQAVDLVEMAQDMLSRAQPQARRRGIDLGLESPEVMETRVDIQVLVSAFENLLNNALAYVQDGARITVSLTTRAGRIELGVADNGPGIPVQERSRLMQRFQRGADARVPGTGLGLAIVTQAATQLGGSLRTQVGLDGAGIGFVILWPLPKSLTA